MLFAAAIVFQLRSFVHILGPPPSDGAIITQKKASVFLLSLQYVYFLHKNTCKQKYLLIQYSQALGHLNKKRWIL